MTPAAASAHTPSLTGRDSVVRLGMPQLAATGLSEPWLLKDLGHRHWLMIAEAAGRDRPEFRHPSGDAVYAAFCGLSVRDARFGTLREHDDLSIRSQIARVSRTQFASRHVLSCGGGPRGSVEMLSVFVRRTAPGQNRSIARVAIEGLRPMPVQAGFCDLVGLAPRIRTGDWTEHFGFRADEAALRGRYELRPCPSLDFNGAGFLYFSAFQAAVDRAEWAIFGETHPLLTTVARDIVYHGNVDIGDAIAVEVLGVRAAPGRLDHWCRITAPASGRRLADVFTQRVGTPCGDAHPAPTQARHRT